MEQSTCGGALPYVVEQFLVLPALRHQRLVGLSRLPHGSLRRDGGAGQLGDLLGELSDGLGLIGRVQRRELLPRGHQLARDLLVPVGLESTQPRLVGLFAFGARGSPVPGSLHPGEQRGTGQVEEDLEEPTG